MPNWASNQIVVEGPEEEIKRFIAHVRTETPYKDEKNGEDKIHVRIFDLNKLCPMPEQLNIGSVPCFPKESIVELQAIADNPEKQKWERETAETQIKMIRNQEELGFSSWYDWCVAKWGTKWNIDTCEGWDHVGKRATLFYDSAWSPPTQAIAEGSKLFPKLLFTNYAMDPSMDWACETKIADGDVEDNCDTLSRMKHVVYDVFGYEDEDEYEDDEEEVTFTD